MIQNFSAPKIVCYFLTTDQEMIGQTNLKKICGINIIIFLNIIIYRGQAELRITCETKMKDYEYQQNKSKIRKKSSKKPFHNDNCKKDKKFL